MAGKEHVVVASDRMVTLSLPSTEFEQNLPKTIIVADNCVAATAGSALAFTPILEQARMILAQEKSSPNIHKIADTIRQCYITARNAKLEQDILAKIGLNLQAFYQANRTFAPEIIANVIQAMNQYDYGLSVIVAGVDASGPHIYRIDDPGRIESFDSIGHCSVGSGELHSISTFIANDYDPNLDLDHVVAMVYDAKKRAEKAQGVGEETDLYIICNNSTVKLTDEKISKLNEIHNKKTEQEKKTVADLEELVKNLGIRSVEGVQSATQKK